MWLSLLAEILSFRLQALLHQKISQLFLLQKSPSSSLTSLSIFSWNWSLIGSMAFAEFCCFLCKFGMELKKLHHCGCLHLFCPLCPSMGGEDSVSLVYFRCAKRDLDCIGALHGRQNVWPTPASFNTAFVRVCCFATVVIPFQFSCGYTRILLNKLCPCPPPCERSPCTSF